MRGCNKIKLLNENQVLDLLKTERRYVFAGKEKDFEEYVIGCLSEIFEATSLAPIRTLKRQHVIQTTDAWVRIDVLVQHEDNSMSVIEIKTVNEKNPQTSVHQQTQAIGQLLLYKAMVEVQYGIEPRLFLIDTEIYARTMLIFKEYKLPVTLMEIQNGRVFIPYANY